MSLIKCPDCGKDVSTRDASCPHCGSLLTTEEIEVGTDPTGKRYRLYIVLGILVCFFRLDFVFLRGQIQRAHWCLLYCNRLDRVHSG